MVQGLQIYFDKALGCNLLYRVERQQFADIRKVYVTGPDVKPESTKAMSEIYGAEHLARMLGACLPLHLSRCHANLSVLSCYAPNCSWLKYGRRVCCHRARICERGHGVSAYIACSMHGLIIGVDGWQRSAIVCSSKSTTRQVSNTKTWLAREDRTLIVFAHGISPACSPLVWFIP